ncbi:murein DD-endopeptidase MepM/ murein hydrolase activator NlpD [Kineosphaera limosa]|uniref:M23ase beta-sheet core domain-containing protein n=1 Tax=Kineosphaera limosa NBRC 100340 TaxID=1184609 RepID=K6VEQ0_9MICO|nr:M23 family metallopeptidase [Kineosphaera limosa]NYD99370.1 murein DD-endopeptidase MepM/ murein hydrolase activator NlpD [Kineosphaera limosa]GAB94673.1 hypothetical protein KILIM_010_00040 [Kineosphaera limosa NBRC 100340]
MPLPIVPLIPVVLSAFGLMPVGAGVAGAGAAATAARTALVVRDVAKAVPRPGWQAPLRGSPEIGRAFDPPKEKWLAGHRGVDLKSHVGASVLAAGNGIVLHAGLVAGKPVVSIQHPNGLRTTYEPVITSVKKGQPVGRGAAIGRLAPGGHCPPQACLHWGARKGAQYVDPLSLLKELSPVLLPVR